jgi:hypothetical protein
VLWWGHEKPHCRVNDKWGEWEGQFPVNKSSKAYRPKLVNIDFSESILSEISKIIRSTGAKYKKTGVKSKKSDRTKRKWRKLKKKAGGEFVRKPPHWIFDADKYVGKLDRNGKFEISPIPEGMKVSLGKNGEFKFSFGRTGMYELLQVRAIDMIEKESETKAKFIAAIKVGKKRGMEYFKVRIGQETAFWQRTIFNLRDIETEIFAFLALMSEYDQKTLQGIRHIYLYGFKDNESAVKFTEKKNVIRKKSAMLRKRKKR